MIRLSKPIAFLLFILVTILLGVTFTNIDWNVFNANNSGYTKFKELREPIIFLLLAIFYIKYYVDILKKENKIE